MNCADDSEYKSGKKTTSRSFSQNSEIKKIRLNTRQAFLTNYEKQATSAKNQIRFKECIFEHD